MARRGFGPGSPVDAARMRPAGRADAARMRPAGRADAARGRPGEPGPAQRSGFSQETSRWNPRAIRCQNPSRAVPGIAVTTWPTVAIGASAIMV